MRKTAIILSVCIMTITSCGSRNQPSKLSYDNPYDLTRLDWNMDAYKFYTQAEDANVWYNGDFINPVSDEAVMEVFVDTVRPYPYDRFMQDTSYDSDKDTVIGLEYTMSGYQPDGVIAVYRNMKFSRMDMIASMDNKLMAVCVNNNFKDKREIDAFLSENKDKMTSSKARYDETEYYTWKESDCIFKLVVEPTEENITRNEMNTGEKTSIEQEIVRVFLFILKEESAHSIIGKIKKGNFSYCLNE